MLLTVSLPRAEKHGLFCLALPSVANLPRLELAAVRYRDIFVDMLYCCHGKFLAHACTLLLLP